MAFATAPSVFCGCRLSSVMRLLLLAGLASLALSVTASEQQQEVAELPVGLDVEVEAQPPAEETVPEVDPEQEAAVSHISGEHPQSKRKELVVAGSVIVALLVSALVLSLSHKVFQQSKVAKEESSQREALTSAAQALVTAHQAELEDLKRRFGQKSKQMINDMTAIISTSFSDLESAVEDKKALLQAVTDKLLSGEYEEALKIATEQAKAEAEAAQAEAEAKEFEAKEFEAED